MKTPRLRTLPPRLSTIPPRLPPPPKRADPFYTSPEWRSLMRRLIAERGRQCEQCGRAGCRISGDHVVELKDGGAVLDATNVRLLCGSCHTAKTAAKRRDRARQTFG